MQALAWLAAVTVFYLAAWLWLSEMVSAVARRRWGSAAALGIILVVAIAAYRLLPSPAVRFWVAIAIILLGCAGTAAGMRGLGWRELRRLRFQRRQVGLHLALLTGALIFSVPFLWLISTSLKADRALFVLPPQWVPRVVHWENYARALAFLPAETRHGALYLWNTIYLSALSIIGVALSGSLVAYSFARLRWPGRDIVFVVLLSTMMLPGAVTMIPVFLIFKSLGWVDTLRPLWVPAFFGGAFNIFLLRQFFMTIPRELEDAAKIDGCSFFGIYSRIMLPLIKPALAAVIILTFMGAWNNFMGPLIYISSPEKMPMAYALQLFQSSHGGEYNLMMAAATMMVVPVILLFFFTQRYFIQGVTLTGIKG